MESFNDEDEADNVTIDYGLMNTLGEIRLQNQNIINPSTYDVSKLYVYFHS